MSGVLVLCDDLMFSGMVSATGRALGIPVAVARTPAAAVRKAAEISPRCVILDLHNPGLDVPALFVELRALGEVRVVGFGSHVDAALLKAARDAGCDPVMPRSQFHKVLERELPLWLSPFPLAGEGRPDEVEAG